MLHGPPETSRGHKDKQHGATGRYFTCAIGTAHRATPNPAATALCHGLINSEKQRFSQLATTGTRCLYLEAEVKFSKAQPPTCKSLFNLLIFAGAGDSNAGHAGTQMTTQGGLPHDRALWGAGWTGKARARRRNRYLAPRAGMRADGAAV